MFICWPIETNNTKNEIQVKWINKFQFEWCEIWENTGPTARTHHTLAISGTFWSCAVSIQEHISRFFSHKNENHLLYFCSLIAHKSSLLNFVLFVVESICLHTYLKFFKRLFPSCHKFDRKSNYSIPNNNCTKHLFFVFFLLFFNCVMKNPKIWSEYLFCFFPFLLFVSSWFIGNFNLFSFLI